MEKIVPSPDHLMLEQYTVGTTVEFRGRPYRVFARTTLASGEPALVLQGEGEQFVVGASQFFAGLKNNH
jgi:hypothetical protein